MAKIAVLGYGTVGSGVVEVINTNSELINRNAGEDISVKRVLDLRDFPGDPVEKLLTHDFEDIVTDPEISVVVEVMGGVEPAYTFVKRCLLAGKSVCTSNKALVAAHGPELIEIARNNNINFFFEASVGGGIPIIRPLMVCLTADEILEISGILNGTTNYMLTKMADEGWEFDEALKTAQELGYAERNPEADIEGFDACRKIAILTSLYTGKNVDFEKIYTEGITKITATDIKYAKKLKRAIKLIASSKKVDGHIYASVCPVMLKKSHPLFNVNDVLNAVFVDGNMLGDTMFYGSGAGKLPTASAVVSDIIQAAKAKGNVYTQWDSQELKLADNKKLVYKFFVRVKGDDKKADEVKKLFCKGKVVKLDDVAGEFGFVTGKMSEEEFDEKYSKLDGTITRIRMQCKD